jgi:quercetin dioxygenase-like cupin family protein
MHWLNAKKPTLSLRSSDNRSPPSILEGKKMGTVKRAEAAPVIISEGRTRYLAHTNNVMIAVVDFNDGPAAQPDPPHSHPHEQVSYVASGEIILIMGTEKARLSEGDLFTVAPNVPHAVQTLTKHVRLIDAFNPIRNDFLTKP